MPSLLDLPAELQLKILRECDPSSLYALRLACNYFRLTLDQNPVFYNQALDELALIHNFFVAWQEELGDDVMLQLSVVALEETLLYEQESSLVNYGWYHMLRLPDDVVSHIPFHTPFIRPGLMVLPFDRFIIDPSDPFVARLEYSSYRRPTSYEEFWVDCRRKFNHWAVDQWAYIAFLSSLDKRLQRAYSEIQNHYTQVSQPHRKPRQKKKEMMLDILYQFAKNISRNVEPLYREDDFEETQKGIIYRTFVRMCSRAQSAPTHRQIDYSQNDGFVDRNYSSLGMYGANEDWTNNNRETHLLEQTSLAMLVHWEHHHPFQVRLGFGPWRPRGKPLGLFGSTPLRLLTFREALYDRYFRIRCLRDSNARKSAGIKLVKALSRRIVAESHPEPRGRSYGIVVDRRFCKGRLHSDCLVPESELDEDILPWLFNDKEAIKNFRQPTWSDYQEYAVGSPGYKWPEDGPWWASGFSIERVQKIAADFTEYLAAHWHPMSNDGDFDKDYYLSQPDDPLSRWYSLYAEGISDDDGVYEDGSSDEDLDPCCWLEPPNASEDGYLCLGGLPKSIWTCYGHVA